MELRVEDLSVSFHKKIVLDHISFSLQEGVYGLIGENGAGKTTLFRSVLGLQRYSGEVIRDGITQVGYVPQRFDSLHGLNLRDTLYYFASLHNIPRVERDKLVDDLLERVNLTEERGKKVRELSGGMLRRLGIAQALLNQPQLLIMDEPTVGLDPTERMRFREIINGIGENRIMIISSHETHELEQICEKILLLHKGKLLCVDTIKNLCEAYQVKDVEELYFHLIGRE